jgi:hypothetical protein
LGLKGVIRKKKKEGLKKETPWQSTIICLWLKSGMRNNIFPMSFRVFLNFPWLMKNFPHFVASRGEEVPATKPVTKDTPVPTLDYVDIPHSQIRKVIFGTTIFSLNPWVRIKEYFGKQQYFNGLRYLSIKLLLDVEVWKCILDVFFVPS